MLGKERQKSNGKKISIEAWEGEEVRIQRKIGEEKVKRRCKQRRKGGREGTDNREK